MMAAIAGNLILGFVIGLSGALAPGPTLVATMGATLRDGWKAGPVVTLGHVMVETAIFFLILAGISTSAVRFTGGIAVIGGAALMVFGILTIRSIAAGEPGATGELPAGSPLVAGIVTSITNPYFWIWWLTIGSVLLMAALGAGIVPAFAFIIGHWSADLGWYTIVALCIHRGRCALTGPRYRAALFLCGLFLIVFGGYYVWTGFTLG
jgi:threonine/homoserine/homoserine lactone efflux protein